MAGFIINRQLVIVLTIILKIMEKLSKRKKAMFIGFAVGLALLGGLGGGWLYSYWFGQITNLKNVGNLSDNTNNVVISGAKQVVVEQDKRTEEVLDSAEKVIVGIFKKRADNNYNLLSSPVAGLIITSDGWLAANWQTKDTQVKAADYVAITKDKKIYNLDILAFDEFSGLTFAHMRGVNSLPVAGFSPSLELKRGQSVFLTSWLKTVSPAILTDDRRRDDILSSDQPLKALSLSVIDPNSLVAVDLSGRVVGWVTKDKQVVSVDYIISAINYLLANQPISRTSLGVNYLNSDYHANGKQPIGALIVKDKKGIAVVAGSPAAKAGLKEGDIIYSIDDRELSNGVDLADVVATYQADQKAIVKYWRGSDKKEAIITFKGL